MFEELIHLDQQWLLAINGSHAAWADSVMWIISGKLTWLPLYTLLITLILIRCKSLNFQLSNQTASLNFKWWLMALIVILAVAGSAGLADFISSGIIKHAVCRWRPTHEPALEGLVRVVNGYTGGRYGFVSSHAADTMACALCFSLFWAYTSNHKKRAHLTVTLPLMVWVALNCYSRMYLGVHYPGDIIGGLLVGAGVAVPVFLALRRVLPAIRDDGAEHRSDPLGVSDREDPRSPACS